MGDTFEDHTDRLSAVFEEDGFEHPEAEDYFHNTDKDLFDLTSKARDEKTNGIRNYFTRKGYLSVKQRWCLCDWLAKNESPR